MARHRLRVRFLLILSTAACWLLLIYLARRGLASDLINPLFIVTLVWTYFAALAVVAARGPRPRIGMFRAIALTGGILSVVIVLEGAALLGRVDYREIVNALRGPEGPDVGFIDDPVLLFRRMPNSRWVGRPRTDMANYFSQSFRTERPIVFSTDTQGFRNAVHPTRADIVLIGDSYIEGWNVSDDETASARLATSTGVTVANLGTAGYGSLQELRVLERYGLPLGPKLVAWFFFEGNDLDDDQNFENAMLADPNATSVTPREPWSHRWRRIVDRSFTANLFEQLRTLANPLVPNRVNTFGWFTDQRGTRQQLYFYDFYSTRRITDYERERLRVTESTLKRAAEECRRDGATFILYFVPIKFRVYGSLCTFPANSPCQTWQPWDLEAEVRAICMDAGITFVSLTDQMHQAAQRGEVLYAPTDSHWDANGQAFVATQVAAAWSGIGHRH